jgi:hypothetical protein
MLFDTFCGHLVYFSTFWYMSKRGKSGNPNNKIYQDFFDDFPRELGGGDLVDKEPRREKEADGKQD